MAVNTESGQMDAGGIDRRSLIKKTAAASAIVWSTPVIAGSMLSPAAASTLPSLCFKYQHNWAGTAASPSLVVCLNNKTDPDQTWTDPCTESLPVTRRAGEAVTNDPAIKYDSNSCHPGRNCCQPKDAGGNSIDWWQGNADFSEKIGTFPNPECVFTEPVCPAVNPGYNDNETITFHIDRTQCPGCYFADGAIVYTTNPDSCSDLSFSCNQVATSEFFNSIQFKFEGSTLRYPIYFKFWIACNLNWNADTEQNVPNSQCDIPLGEPNANPGHALGQTLIKVV